MSRAAIQSLSTLLPTLSTLPDELVELAASLLAQSQSKATSLKQEEEIARSYTCAHIACERLKTKLDLPTITARPPCPPRIYKKLYAFLDSVLVAQTPRKRIREPVENSGPDTTATTTTTTTVTPSKRRHPTPSSRITPRKKAQKEALSDNDLERLLPIIRQVCDALDWKAGTPHVYTGVSTILTQEHDTRSDQEQTLALIIAVAVTVVKRQGRDLIPRPFEAAARRLLESDDVIATYRSSISVDEGLMDQLMTQPLKILRNHEKDWRNMDWYQNIPRQAEYVEASGIDDSEIEVSGERNEDDLTAVTASKLAPKSSKKRKLGHATNDDWLEPGLGTMFCDAVDWLSDDRRAAYKLWKHGIMARIEEMV